MAPLADSDLDPHQTPPENAIRTLKAFVLFSTLESDFRPFKMPTIIAKMTISPREHTVKEMLEILFLSIDS